jgi:hypothetical protein
MAPLTHEPAPRFAAIPRRAPGPSPRQRTAEKEPMTTVPNEINAAAVKNSPAEKVTPMMQQYHSATF